MSDAASNGERCEATTASGRRCKVTNSLRQTADGWRCLWHDPERGHAVRVRAGRNSQARKRAAALQQRIIAAPKTPPLPTSQEQCEDTFRWLFEQTAQGRLQPQVARELTTTIDKLHHAIGARLNLEKGMKELRKQFDRLEAEDRKRGTLA
jgi:hypothetical protein